MRKERTIKERTIVVTGNSWWQRLWYWLELDPAPAPRLYDRLSEEGVLTSAWKSVRRVPTAGIDGVTARHFEADWPRNMADLARALSERSYHPLPVRRFLMAKADGGRREIAVLALRDRTVQRAVYEVVLPRFEAIASDASFAYRPGLNREAAIDRLIELRLAGHHWVLNADIRSFFDEIDQRRALRLFERVVRDREITGLVAEWLEMGVFRPEAVAARGEGRERRPPGRRSEGEAWPVDHWVGEAERLTRSAYELVRRAQALAQAEDARGGKAVRSRPSGGLAGRALTVADERVAWVAPAQALASRLPWRRLSARPLLELPWKWVGTGAALVGGACLIAAGARPAVAELRRDRTAGRGLPQGSVLSPMLANAGLADLDHALTRQGLAFVRYSDNLVVVGRGEPDVTRALRSVRRELGRAGLALNEAKTEIVPYDAGFEFLGERFPRYERHTPDRASLSELTETFARSAYWQVRRLALDRSERRADR